MGEPGAHGLYALKSSRLRLWQSRLPRSMPNSHSVTGCEGQWLPAMRPSVAPSFASLEQPGTWFSGQYTRCPHAV